MLPSSLPSALLAPPKILPLRISLASPDCIHQTSLRRRLSSVPGLRELLVQLHRQSVAMIIPRLDARRSRQSCSNLLSHLIEFGFLLR